MTTTTSVIAVAAAAAALVATGALATPRLPQFDPETRQIKIVQFTDLHFGEGEGKDNHSLAIQGLVLEMEKPDLVILTGDMISGFAWNRVTVPWFKPLLARVVSPMEERGIPWIYAIGNHDNQGDVTNRTEIMEYAQSFPHSLSRPGPVNLTGSSNYHVPIMSSTGDGSVAANMWMMDTGDNNCLGIQGWDCVYPDQIDWFRQENRALGLGIPGMMWMHIPVHEVMDMWNFHTVQGRLEDVGVCCPSANTGLWAAAKESGNIVSMAFGHDHSNDFISRYHGITLAYGRKSGVGCYGPPPDMQRGARVWLLNEPPKSQPLNLTFSTWIRQENGAVETQSEQVHSPNVTGRFQVCCDAALVSGVRYEPQLPACERYAREWQMENLGEIYVRQFMGTDFDPEPKRKESGTREKKEIELRG